MRGPSVDFGRCVVYRTFALPRMRGADVVELVYTADLKSAGLLKTYGFESRRPHQQDLLHRSRDNTAHLRYQKFTFWLQIEIVH